MRRLQRNGAAIDGFYDQAWTPEIRVNETLSRTFTAEVAPLGAVEIRCSYAAWHAHHAAPPEGAILIESEGSVRTRQYIVRRSLDLDDWGDMEARDTYIRRVQEDLERFLPGRAWINIKGFNGRWHRTAVLFEVPPALYSVIEALFYDPDSNPESK